MSMPSSTRIEHVVVEVDAPRENKGMEELPPNESMLPIQLRLVVVESSAKVMRSTTDGFNTGSYELERLPSLFSACFGPRSTPA
mmetsp:Transcript_43409/g.86092  ORF Transcript_43409/g.86092 Transcript_43409/m.86092 type:complete len:84 (+) Transcript_43409:434-685(+)